MATMIITDTAIVAIMLVASIMSSFFAMALAAAGNASTELTASPPVPDDNAMQLLVIELFFLAIGLMVAAVLVFLIWQSWREKRDKARK